MTDSYPDVTIEASPPDLLEARRALLTAFDVPGPRYTSYPTADRFVEAFGASQWQQALAQRASGAGLHGGLAAPWSVYVHIPFCESVCYYCACHKIVTRRHERAAAYLDSLEAEIALVTAQLGPGHRVSQLHLGGGTPTFFSDEELTRLMASLRSAVRFSDQGEFAIEVDPRTVDAGRLHHLAALGFNRLSLGIQDFDPAVQQAVHRIQPYDSVAALMGSAREAGFRSINMDLIYGLPGQTRASFARSLGQVAALRPERIAVYAYAHLPQRFKPQRRIDAKLLPAAPDKIGMLSQAIDQLQAAGYEYIGMDHFALPDDPLAVARRQGRLHRNFQGYSTQPESDLIGLGVSAISKVGPHYSQNVKALDEYDDALARGELPVARGLSLSRDDLLRRAVIMAIMCQGRVDFESIELAHLIDFKRYFGAELETLAELADRGLVTLEADGLCVTPLGWYAVRAIAMVFDKHLQADRAATRFSKIL